MDKLIKADKAYIEFIRDIKQRIQAAQIKASVAVNHGLIELYWDMGASIIEKQKQTAWGEGFLQQMSVDLQREFPDIQGFSYRNLKYIRQWYMYWSVETIGQQVVAQLGQIPWGHNLVIISKIKDQQEALFYIQKTIENNWSRAVLTHQIEGKLFQRTGKAINNFEVMLPKPQSDLARETLKDPYKFDFLMLREKHDERELENALVDQVTRFLMELGAGFSFLGRQYKLTVGDEDFYPDMLFYHTRLHCYVVVYALKDISKPIGVSEYEISSNLPDEYKSSLPSIEEIGAELEGRRMKCRTRTVLEYGKFSKERHIWCRICKKFAKIREFAIPKTSTKKEIAI